MVAAEPDTAVDAVLVVGFGGPEGMDDVLPFLRNVTAGRGVPDERLAEVAKQYELFGGVSPINEQNRALVAALSEELVRRGHDLPVAWGNRNWAPYLADTVRELADAGHQRVLALVTSAYSSYSSCRQYLEDIERAREAYGPDAPPIQKVRPFWNHPGFVEANADRVRTAIGEIDPDLLEATRLVFTAHSIPQSTAGGCDYEQQLLDMSRLVVEHAGTDLPWDLVFQSRSGPPQVPWLEPDIDDHLRALAAGGTKAVVVSPIGFLSDHMEVVYDLDTKASAVAEDVGLTMVRSGTAGLHPGFVRGLGDLVDEVLVGAEPKALGPLGARPSPCEVDCCPAPVRVRR